MMLAIFSEQKSKKKVNERFVLTFTIFLHHALLNLLLRNVISCFFRVSKVMKSVAINQREKFHKYVFWCWYHHILNLKRF